MLFCKFSGFPYISHQKLWYFLPVLPYNPKQIFSKKYKLYFWKGGQNYDCGGKSTNKRFEHRPRSSPRSVPGQDKRREIIMKNNNQINGPQAREAMDRFKMQAASEVGVNLTNGYNGHLTSREAGSVGGQMVKKMIEAYEQGMQ